MKFQVTVSAEAQACIDDQSAWYGSEDEHGGEALALRWIEKLYPVLSSLAEMPSKNGFAPENGRGHPAIVIRQRLFRPWKKTAGWRVLYTIDEQAKIVTVLQIRHEHRRWLFENDET